MFNHLKEDIQHILKRDPAAKNAWEVLTCYPGLHAIVMHRWANFFWQRQFYWLGRFISHLARFFTGIEIHPGAVIGRRVFIDHGFGVVVGETAEIGDECTIYQGVTLGGTSLAKGAKRHPTLEGGVIIGAGAQVLGNITIGALAKVGSNSVVVKSVPAGATAVGNPAHVIIQQKNKNGVHNASSRFSSYGLSANADDPISKALHKLIDHAALQERKIAYLQSALKQAGIRCEMEEGVVQFNSDQLNKSVE
ncbi:MAG: cysE [Solimicrobium sp.]|nr:cysE [Solimicrobium sp.]